MNKIGTDEIIQGILNSDENIIKYVYSENYIVIRKFINDNTGNDDETADVFQDAIMVIYNKAKEGNLNIYVSFGTYLFSIAKRLWYDQLRKKSQKNIVSDLQGIDVIDDVDEFDYESTYNERHKLIWKHFEKLTEDCRKVIKLFIDQHSITEVTGIMQYSSEQHTKNKRFRCKNRLIELIIKDPQFKTLKNEKVKDNDKIGRW
jgi:RNA polymerase sigma factor (sigma-70 family)